MFVSVTRLRLRSVLFLPAFVLANERCLAQLRRSTGFRGGGELIDRGLTFWTVTVWESEGAMKAYRGSDAHATAMRRLPDWCSEASVVHWQQQTSNVPGWDEAHRRLSESGRLSRVNRPNANHTARRYRAPSSSQWRRRPITRVPEAIP